MQLNQNRIELQLRCGYYEEFILEPEDTSILLPGSLVSISRAYCSDPCYVSSHGHHKADNSFELVNLELVVVIENALIGTGIHNRQIPGEILLARRALPGDVYLLRAVAGEYSYGTPLYVTQTDNGIYVSASGEGRFVGHSQENFVITPDMVGIYDTSTRDQPMRPNLNGKLLNLLKVRIDGSAHTRVIPKRIEYSVDIKSYPNEDNKATISLEFQEPPEAGLEINDFIIPDSKFRVTGITSVSETLFDVNIKLEQSTDSIEFSLKTAEVDKSTKEVVVEPVGYWGVCYPNLYGHSTPNAQEILGLNGLHRITGSKRNIDVIFNLDQTDWEEAGGEGDFNLNGSGMGFFVTKNWGTALDIRTATEFNLFDCFEIFTVEIRGTEYYGYLATGSSVVYDGSATYTFKFIE